jgi:hypothetical protein
MRIACDIEEVILENEDGWEVDGVTAICSRCQWSTESFGTGNASRKRCLALMREECPQSENNFYWDYENE